MWRACFRIVVVVALCLCSLAQSQSDIFPFPDKRPETKRYCGSNLVDILQLVCNGKYYSNINNSNNYSPHVGRKKSMPGNFSDILSLLLMNPIQGKTVRNGTVRLTKRLAMRPHYFV